MKTTPTRPSALSTPLVSSLFKAFEFLKAPKQPMNMKDTGPADSSQERQPSSVRSSPLGHLEQTKSIKPKRDRPLEPLLSGLRNRSRGLHQGRVPPPYTHTPWQEMQLVLSRGALKGSLLVE